MDETLHDICITDYGISNSCYGVNLEKLIKIAARLLKRVAICFNIRNELVMSYSEGS